MRSYWGRSCAGVLQMRQARPLPSEVVPGHAHVTRGARPHPPRQGQEHLPSLSDALFGAPPSPALCQPSLQLLWGLTKGAIAAAVDVPRAGQEEGVVATGRHAGDAGLFQPPHQPRCRLRQCEAAVRMRSGPA